MAGLAMLALVEGSTMVGALEDAGITPVAGKERPAIIDSSKCRRL